MWHHTRLHNAITGVATPPVCWLVRSQSAVNSVSSQAVFGSMFLTLASNTSAGTCADTLYIFLGGLNQCTKWKLNENILSIWTKLGYIVSLRESTLFRVCVSDGPISRGLNRRESVTTCRGVGKSAKLLLIPSSLFPLGVAEFPIKLNAHWTGKEIFGKD